MSTNGSPMVRLGLHKKSERVSSGQARFFISIVSGSLIFDGRCPDLDGEFADAVYLCIGDRVVRCRRSVDEVVDGVVSKMSYYARFSTSGGWKWIKLYAKFKENDVFMWSKLIYNYYPSLADVRGISHNSALMNKTSFSVISIPAVRRTSRVAVVLHLYYFDLWSEFASLLRNISEPFDLYVTVCCNPPPEINAKIFDFDPEVTILLAENRGRDILPYLQSLKVMDRSKYEYVCKIHSKKSQHRRDGGDSWRVALLGDLLGSKKVVASLVNTFDANPKLGLVAPWDNLCEYSKLPGMNKEMVSNLAHRMVAAEISKFPFPKGSMFWARMAAMEPLMSANIRPEEFAPEAGQMDGTIAHAIERVFGLSALKAGFNCEEAPEFLPFEI
jgi:hypothetical protein